MLKEIKNEYITRAFQFKGETSRQSYIYVVIFQFILGFIGGTALLAAIMSNMFSATTNNFGGIGITILLLGAITILLVLDNLAINFRRLNDIGFKPIHSTIILILMIILPFTLPSISSFLSIIYTVLLIVAPKDYIKQLKR